MKSISAGNHCGSCRWALGAVTLWMGALSVPSAAQTHITMMQNASTEAIKNTRSYVANQRGKQQFGFLALNVSDMDKALAFYKGVVGLTEGMRMDRPMSLIIPLDYPDAGNDIPKLHLIYDKKGAALNPIIKGNAISRIAFFVRDIEGVAERLSAAGFAVDGPTEMTDIKLKYLFTWDPDGNRVEFIQPS